jgi:uncharacterized membrane protein (UPF0127 family)
LTTSIWFFPYHCNSTACLQNNAQNKAVLIKNNKVFVTIANTDAEKEQGLSGRDGLKENEGLLFVFDKSDTYGFWMKDMKFSIDIIWIQNEKIVFIQKAVSPSSYPTVFVPTESANMVMELPSGFCDTHGILVGDSFSQLP